MPKSDVRPKGQDREKALREQYAHVWEAIAELKNAKLDGISPIVQFDPHRESQNGK